jgi:hypothetical protein
LMPVHICLAAVMAPLPNRPISRDQVVLMKRENMVGPTALSFAELGLAPSPVEGILTLLFADPLPPRSQVSPGPV